MCLPALPLLALAGGAMSAAGAISQGQSANNQAQYESKVAKQNAAMEVESAHQSIAQGRNEARDFWRDVSATKGQQVAAMAANGIDVGFGSADRQQSDTAMVAGERSDTLYKNINERTRGHYINSSNYVSEAKAARARGKAAVVGSYFSAASSVLGGATQAFGMMQKSGGAGANTGTGQ